MSNMIYEIPIVEIIKNRISVRSYDSRNLDEEIKAKLMKYLDNLKGPFEAKTRYRIIENESAKDKDIKLGTYGMIRGATSYVASAVSKGDMYLEQLGYELEDFILYATSLGLGTCWMGGTFKKGEFAKAMDIKEQEILPIVTPIGYPSKNKKVIDYLIRAAAGSKSRKPWEELFFKDSFNNILTQTEAGEYKDALEMIRMAPSASNKQPWRIIKENNRFHFYLAPTKGYSERLSYNIQKVDMGIAMCHFEFTLKEAGILGKWEKLKSGEKQTYEYISTFVI